LIIRNIVYRALPALILAAAVPASVAAQSAPAPASVPVPAADQPYAAVFDVLVGGLDIDQMAQVGADEIFDGMVRNDNRFASMARSQPDLKTRFRAVAKPYLATWIKRSNDMRRPLVIDVLKKNLTLAEAREVAAFYGSPLGRKFMQSYSRNLSADKTVDAAIRGRTSEVDKAAQRADEKASVDSTVAALLPSLTMAEQRQLIAFSGTQGFRKMQKMGNVMSLIPEPSFEQITTKAEREEFGAAVRKLFTEALARETGD